MSDRAPPWDRVLAACANDWQPEGVIADEAGVSWSAVHRLLRALERQGHVGGRRAHLDRSAESRGRRMTANPCDRCYYMWRRGCWRCVVCGGRR